MLLFSVTLKEKTKSILSLFKRHYQASMQIGLKAKYSLNLDIINTYNSRAENCDLQIHRYRYIKPFTLRVKLGSIEILYRILKLLPSWLEAFKVVVAYFWVTCDPKTYEFGPHIATYEDQILNNIFITG